MSFVAGLIGGAANAKLYKQQRADKEREFSIMEAAVQNGGGYLPERGAEGMADRASPSAILAIGAGEPRSYRDAIASIESAGSGDYAAVGPTHPKLGRALGRYQVMEANIGPWSKAALGREVTADEFMKDPKIQDAIFDHQFDQYVDKYGEEGAAQAWFGGAGGVGKTSRTDSLGTSIGEYGTKFRAALGRPQAATPAAQPAAAPEPAQWRWFENLKKELG